MVLRCLLLFLSAVTLSHAGDSLVIGSVDLVRSPVFDTVPDPAGQPFYTALNRGYRIANRINSLTRPGALRREFLFAVGDPVRPALLQETARNLRRLGVVGDVRITADTLDNRSVAVIVQTREKWTKLLEGEFRQDGGVRRLYLGLKDNNFLGTVRSIGLGYDYATDRNDPHGFSLSFSDPRLLDSRWELAAELAESEVKRERSVWLLRPFGTEGERWSGGALFSVVPRKRDYYYDNAADSVIEGYRAFTDQALWFSRRFGGRHRLSAGAAVLVKRTSSASLPVQAYDNQDMGTVSIGYLHRTYYEACFVDGYGRTEDIVTGAAVNLTAGRNLAFAETESFDTYTSAEIRAAGRTGRTGYCAGYLSAASFLRDEGWSESTVRAGCQGYLRLPFKQTLAARVVTARGIKWNDSRYFELDSPSGLRGYPVNRLAGSRVVLMNLEDRSCPLVRAWFFNIAPVIFLDAGAVWNREDRLAGQRMLWSAGTGIRLENTKQQGAGITRVDLAYNPVDASVALIISTGQLFKVVSGLSFYGPDAIFN